MFPAPSPTTFPPSILCRRFRGGRGNRVPSGRRPPTKIELATFATTRHKRRRSGSSLVEVTGGCSGPPIQSQRQPLFNSGLGGFFLFFPLYVAFVAPTIIFVSYAREQRVIKRS